MSRRPQLLDYDLVGEVNTDTLNHYIRDCKALSPLRIQDFVPGMSYGDTKVWKSEFSQYSGHFKRVMHFHLIVKQARGNDELVMEVSNGVIDSDRFCGDEWSYFQEVIMSEPDWGGEFYTIQRYGR
jgi:hypothetical protein